jgi:galactose-1-phosphate uridylyltransferase
MDIEALIKNLQALSDTLKSTAIREGESLNDFKMSVERFEAVFSDLIGVSKSNLEISSPETKKTLKELSEILTEIGNYSDQQIDILQFVSEIAPKK